MPENITINPQQHNITISEPMRDYHLPIASATVLGGIKVGSNLTIDEEGTLSAEATEYTLPTASASTLGGVKVGGNLSINNGILTADVDSVLSGSSTNPVQNSVIKSNIDSINSTLVQYDLRIDNLEGSVSGLSTTVGGHTTSITNLGNDVDALETAVGNNTSDIGTNTGNIAANALAISGLDGRLDTAEDNITGLGNSVDTMSGQVGELVISTDTEVTYSYLLPVNTWTQGKITYSKRGKVGVITFDLNGNMSLAAGNETQIYQLPDTFQNSIICKGTLDTNLGPLTVTLDATRNISFVNITASNMTQITKVRGQLVVVLD